MSKLRLNDLDELILMVRDKVSQLYIAEAVDAYRGGAYRAATISAWIAVTSDIIAKIRELASQGDNNANSTIRQLDSAIEANNLTQLQKIENNLLQKAKEEFEFLSVSEHEDLSRLRHDRNLCAHPAFVQEGVLFQPTPELVRTHIVHAVLHLLQHQPIQGKSALSRIVQDLIRPSFPQDIDDVTEYLSKKYLTRAKEALVRNLLVLLLKEALRGEKPELIGRENAILASIVAISRKFPIAYEEQLKTKLPGLVDSLDDDQLKRVFRLLGVDQRCWSWLDEPSKIRIDSMVKNLEFEEMVQFGIFELVSLSEFRKLLLDRFDSLEHSEKIQVISANPRPEFKNEAIDLFSNAWGWRIAENLGENVLLPMARFFSPEDITSVLLAAGENDQINDASGMPDIMVRFFEKTKHFYPQTKSDWISFVDILSTDLRRDSSYPRLRKKLDEFDTNFVA